MPSGLGLHGLNQLEGKDDIEDPVDLVYALPHTQATSPLPTSFPSSFFSRYVLPS